MATTERWGDRGTRIGMRMLRSVGNDFREARVAAGLSQESVANAAQLSRAHYSRIENGQIANLSLLEAARIANVLGLDLSIRLYPGGNPLRDGAQVKRLATLLREVGPPLSYRTEVPLPNVVGRSSNEPGTRSSPAEAGVSRSKWRCRSAIRRPSSAAFR